MSEDRKMQVNKMIEMMKSKQTCLLYTSDAADEEDSEILHSGEAGMLSGGSNLGTNSFIFAVTCVLRFIALHS